MNEDKQILREEVVDRFFYLEEIQAVGDMKIECRFVRCDFKDGCSTYIIEDKWERGGGSNVYYGDNETEAITGWSRRIQENASGIIDAARARIAQAIAFLQEVKSNDPEVQLQADEDRKAAIEALIGKVAAKKTSWIGPTHYGDIDLRKGSD